MSFSKFNEIEKENGNDHPIQFYDQSQQQQMNYQSEQSKISEQHQSVIKKLLYNDYNFNSQVSENQKKILLYENSRLTMKAASQLLQNEELTTQEQQTTSKNFLKKNGKSMSVAFIPQQNQKISQKQYDEDEQQEQTKNIWDELYQKALKKKVMIELQMKQGEQEKIENQIQDLTFHPKLVADSSIYNINQPFQERNSNWQDAKNKKLAEIKKYYTESEDFKQIKECTFQPQILNKSRQITQSKPKKQTENQQIKSQQQLQPKNTKSYKQHALKKQEFLKQKDLLHRQLQELEIDL